MTPQLYLLSLAGYFITFLNLFIYFKHKNRNDMIIPIYETKFFGIFTLIFNTLLLIFLINNIKELWLFVFMTSLSSIGQLITLHSYIEFDENGFYARKFWLKKRYHYQDLKYYKKKDIHKYRDDYKTYIYFYFPSKVLKINCESINFIKFYAYMEKSCKKHHKHNMIQYN